MLRKFQSPYGYEIKYDDRKFGIVNNIVMPIENCPVKKTHKELMAEQRDKIKREKEAEKLRRKQELERIALAKSYIGKRLLVKASKYSEEVKELIVREISPSGTFVLVMDFNGKKEWTMYSSISVTEVIGEYRPKSKTTKKRK